MRAVFWKELRESTLGLIAGLALAAFFGLMMGLSVHRDVAMGLVFSLGFEGCVLGASQSLLDRRAAGDAFLLHRPVSAVRIHVARSAAGIAVMAVVVGATFAVMSYVAYRGGFDARGNPLPNWNDRAWWNDLTSPRRAFAVLFGLATWTLVRYGASATRPLVAALLALTLPVALVMIVGRTPGAALPTAIVIAAVVVATLLGLANAAERRSARRS